MKVLEIGGGEKPLHCQKFSKEFVNMDIRKIDDWVDIIADLDSPFPIGEAEFDHIYSRYCIEHINWRVLPQFIGEMYRVLKPGGTVYIIAPNLRAQCEIILSMRDITLKDHVCMIFGDNNYKDNSHKSSCTPELYEKLFIEAGFKDFIWQSLPAWRGDMIIQCRK